MSKQEALLSDLESKITQLENELERVKEEQRLFQEEQAAILDEEFARELELAAEEALIVGYEMGYVHCATKQREKQLYIEQAANSFDEIMGAPEQINTDLLDEVLVHYFSEPSEDALEAGADPFAAEEQLSLSDKAPASDDLFEQDEFEFNDTLSQGTEMASASEVAAAIRGWVGKSDETDAEPTKKETAQEELILETEEAFA